MSEAGRTAGAVPGRRSAVRSQVLVERFAADAEFTGDAGLLLSRAGPLPQLGRPGGRERFPACAGLGQGHPSRCRSPISARSSSAKGHALTTGTVLRIRERVRAGENHHHLPAQRRRPWSPPLAGRMVEKRRGHSWLESLWRSWEHFRLDGATGMSVCWRGPRRPPHGRSLRFRGPLLRFKGRERERRAAPLDGATGRFFSDVRMA
jgi:Domain of unknown function (DUF4913)